MLLGCAEKEHESYKCSVHLSLTLCQSESDVSKVRVEKNFLPLQFVSSSSEQIGGRDGTDPLLAVWKIRKIGNCKCLPDVEREQES